MESKSTSPQLDRFTLQFEICGRELMAAEEGLVTFSLFFPPGGDWAVWKERVREGVANSKCYLFTHRD